MKKNTKSFVFLFFFLSGLFCFSSFALAESVNFSQSILPVKMVYVGEENSIKNIWSNVGPTDNLFVLKFLDYKNQKEQKNNSDLLENYQKAVLDSCWQENNGLYEGGKSFSVDFVNRSSVLEEVHTYS